MTEDAAARAQARDRAIRRGGVATLRARVVTAVVTVLILAVASRSLTHAEFGIVSTLASLYIVASYAGLGLGGVLMTRLAAARGSDDHPAMQRHMSDAVTALGIIGGAIAALGTVSVFVLPWRRWLGAPHLPQGEVQLAVGLFFLFAGFSIITIVGSSVLVAMQRLATDQTWTAIGAVASLLLSVAAAALDLPPWGYIVAITAVPGIVAAGRATWAIVVEYPYLRPRRLARLDRHLVEFMKSSGYLGLINISAALSIGVDAVVVSAVMGASAAAVFNVASRLFLIMSTVIGLVGRQVWSALAEAISRGDYGWARSRYWRAIIAAFTIMTVGSGLIVALGRPISHVWVGSGLEPPISLLLAIGGFTIFSTVATQASVLLMATQRLRTLALVGLVQTPINVIASVYFTRHFGLVGPILGSTVAAVPILTPVLFVLTRRLLRGLEAPPSGIAEQNAALVEPPITSGPVADPLAIPAPLRTQRRRPQPGRLYRRTLAERWPWRLIMARPTRARGAVRTAVLGVVALALFSAALRQGGTSLVLTSALIIALSIATVLRVDLYRAGLIATCGYVFCCSWTGWYVAGGLRPRALLELLALVVLIPAHVRGRLPRIPNWYWAIVAAVGIDLVFDLLVPTDPHYLALRYSETGAGGFGLNLTTGLSDFGTAERFLLTLLGTALIVSICALRFPRAPLWIAIAYVAGAATSAWVAFADFAIHTHIGLSVTHVPLLNGRAPGFTNHPNILAGASVYGVAIAAWLMASQTRRLRNIGLILLPGLVGGIYASGSRGGVLTLVLAVALCMTFLPQYRRAIAFGLALFGILVAIAFGLNPDLGHKLLVATRLAGNTGGSNSGRIAVLTQGFRDFEHSPVWGVGLHVIDEAHNVVVQSLASGGVILCAAFLVTQIGSAVSAARLRGVDPLGAPLFVTVVVGFAFGNLENTLTEPFVWVPAALIVAILAQRAAAPPPAPVPPPERTRTMLPEPVG
jgi:O-antigen/teichoic acid export membrane protein